MCLFSFPVVDSGYVTAYPGWCSTWLCCSCHKSHIVQQHVNTLSPWLHRVTPAFKASIPSPTSATPCWPDLPLTHVAAYCTNATCKLRDEGRGKESCKDRGNKRWFPQACRYVLCTYHIRDRGSWLCNHMTTCNIMYGKFQINTILCLPNPQFSML